jgi:hypothetical protein
MTGGSLLVAGPAPGAADGRAPRSGQAVTAYSIGISR